MPRRNRLVPLSITLRFRLTSRTQNYYAKYFLGAFPPPDYVFTTPFTTVSAVTRPPKPRSDRSGGNHPAGINKASKNDWIQPEPAPVPRDVFPRTEPAGARLVPQTLAARWDMNNLQGVLPDSWIFPGNHGIGHAFGKQRHSLIGQLFGLEWVAGNFTAGTRLTDPNYYGHWKYLPQPQPVASQPRTFSRSSTMP